MHITQPTHTMTKSIINNISVFVVQGWEVLGMLSASRPHDHVASTKPVCTLPDPEKLSTDLLYHSTQLCTALKFTVACNLCYSTPLLLPNPQRHRQLQPPEYIFLIQSQSWEVLNLFRLRPPSDICKTRMQAYPNKWLIVAPVCPPLLIKFLGCGIYTWVQGV